MATELQNLKEAVESGDSWVEAMEFVDLDQMEQEGDCVVAEKIRQALVLISEISDAAGVE